QLVGTRHDPNRSLASRRAVFRRQSMFATGGPAPFHNVEALADVTAGSDCPDDVGRVGDIDIVVHDYDKLATVGSRPRASGHQQRLFGVSGIALLDGDHGKRARLAAVDETPDALHFR